MSFHTGQTFTFGETPSATKWNYLWENDYALADGTGIEAEAIQFSHLDVADIISNQQAWQAPTLLNSWVNYQDPSTNFPQAGYYKDSLGYVRLRGLIKSGTTTSSTDLFILPAGYRPEYNQHFATTSNGAFCVIRVEQDGGVEISGGASAPWIDLSNVHFRAA